MNADHPTITLVRGRAALEVPAVLDADWLRAVALAAGADDVAFVSADHPDLADELPHVREAMPAVHALVPFVVRMARAPIRSPTRSVANGEFHRSTDRVAEVGDAIVRALEARGVPALHPSGGFPMEMDRFPGRTWVVSHKRVAQAAGLGHMGLHRNLIHPVFGSFVLLGTVLVGRPVAAEPRTFSFDPCVDCKLCVAACPVGAIGSDGAFDFAACLTHNYREFMGGFADWVGTVADSADRWDYRARVAQHETASLWQSLSFGANYKAAYCVAACPAGEDVIGPFLRDRRAFRTEVLDPLRDKVEPVYVLPGSDAEAHVRARHPHKAARPVEGGLFADSVDSFLRGAPLLFQRRKAASEQIRAVVAFRFTGEGARDTTLRIGDGQLAVTDGLAEDADVTVTIDGKLWCEVVARRRNPVWLVLTGRMRIRGDRAALDRLQRCFPG